jgi:hypothetical protein
LSKEVQQCGCFFIASAEGMVGECPGVSLFEWTGYIPTTTTTTTTTTLP